MEKTLFGQTGGPFGQKEYAVALSTFEKIRTAFPALAMNLDLRPANVELAMDIPTQSGLDFKMHLNLQNLNELHIVASAFWMEWFPCTKPEIVERYFEAVSGLLSGEFRILEHWRGRRPVRAQLQRPCHDRWKTIASWGDVSAIVPWPPKTLKIVQNMPLHSTGTLKS